MQACRNGVLLASGEIVLTHQQLFDPAKDFAWAKAPDCLKGGGDWITPDIIQDPVAVVVIWTDRKDVTHRLPFILSVDELHGIVVAIEASWSSTTTTEKHRVTSPQTGEEFDLSVQVHDDGDKGTSSQVHVEQTTMAA